MSIFSTIKKTVKDLAEDQGYAIIGVNEIRRLEEAGKVSEFVTHADFLAFLEGCKPENLERLLKLRTQSASQILQDLFVLDQLDFKEGGVFVEFGAADGRTFSNSILLERAFGWGGVLVEPCKHWHEVLRDGRTCTVDTRCVWSETGAKVEFIETDLAELSTISQFKENDYAADIRVPSRKYEVETVSLSDLLNEHLADKKIDYLSIDTEGSELDILQNFDFQSHDIKIITCEHNYNGNRAKIRDLLVGQGYTQRMAGISKFDDWYTRL